MWSVVIRVRGVHVVHAVVNGVADHFDRLSFVYLAVHRGEAHRAKPEGGDLPI
jgi:hypothetical protein